MLKTMILAFIMACGACEPPKVEIAPIAAGQDTQQAEPYPWATWEECSQLIGSHPCNFILQDQNGNTVELYQHYGKVIIVDLSVMWCGPCNSAAPHGEIFKQTYGEENFIWLTILLEDHSGNLVDQEDLQSWAFQHNLTDPVLASTREEMIDLEGKTGYPVAAWPTMVVIDREMILQYGISGWNSQQIQLWIESLL
jgi:hypothetical protein